MDRRRFLGALALASVTAAAAACDRPGNTASSAGLDTALEPFVSGRRSVASTGLPRRIAWANTSETEIFSALSDGYAQAAAKRGLEYLTANSDGDQMRNITQIRNFLSVGVGGLLIQPLAKEAQQPIMREALSKGIQVQAIITDPCTLQVVTTHFQTGFQMGQAAADYVKKYLGGQAEVLNLNQDALSAGLRQRHLGVLAGLRTGGSGIHVTDVAATTLSNVGAGYSQILQLFQSNPKIMVILGPDTNVAGAYRALETIGALRPDMYLAGTDGHAEARRLIKEGGPFRASYAFPWRLMGYALGNFAADWIDGLEVPRAMVALAQPLADAASIDNYDTVNERCADVFADVFAPTDNDLGTYLPLLGNVGYANRSLVWEGPFES